MKIRIIPALAAAALALAAFPAGAGAVLWENNSTKVSYGSTYLSKRSAVDIARQARHYIIDFGIQQRGWSHWRAAPLGTPRRVTGRSFDVRVWLTVYDEPLTLNSDEEGESVTFTLRIRRFRRWDGSVTTWAYDRAYPHGSPDELPWRPLASTRT